MDILTHLLCFTSALGVFSHFRQIRHLKIGTICACGAPLELLVDNRMEGTWGRGGETGGGAGGTGSNEPRQVGQMMWENQTQITQISLNLKMDSYVLIRKWKTWGGGLGFSKETSGSAKAMPTLTTCCEHRKIKLLIPTVRIHVIVLSPPTPSPKMIWITVFIAPLDSPPVI